MSEIEDRAMSHLMMIEKMYGTKILNRDELARFIAQNVSDQKKVLKVGYYLTSWLAMNKAGKEVTIPTHALQPILQKLAAE